LVLIHAFPNGNGRHARLATDLLLHWNGQSQFTWGSVSLIKNGQARQEYITALREADGGSIDRLLQFVRS
jgi:Fic family protein